MINRSPAPGAGPVASLSGDEPGARRILVLSGDVLPFAGLPTSGAGLRAWGIAHGLASVGHDVTVLMPTGSLEATPADDATKVWIRPWTFDPSAASTTIARWRPDIVVLQHWWLATHIEPGSTPLVIDLHGPLLMETLYQSHADYEALARQKIAALSKADFVTCAGDVQRHYFFPWLMLAGYDLRVPSVAAVPVSLSPDLPSHHAEGDVSFVYGGIYLPWQNPLRSLDTLVRRLETRDRGTLHFFGGPHPVLRLAAAEYEEIERRLSVSHRVVSHGLVSHDHLLVEYARAHVAFDLMARNPERELAFTTRTVEYLWCGLPVIYNNYAELARIIHEYEAGWCLDPEDTPALEAVIDQILDDPAEVARRGANAQRLARERLAWDRAIAPLDAFCRQPYKRRPRDRDLREVGARGPEALPLEQPSPRLAHTLAQVETLALQAQGSADLLQAEAIRRRSPGSRAAGWATQRAKQALGLDRGLVLAEYGATYAGDLADGAVHAQSFVCGAGMLYRVDVVFATFGRLNAAMVRLRLRELTQDGRGVDLVQVVVPAAVLPDNRPYAVVFEPLSLRPGAVVLLQVDSPDAAPGNTVGLWAQSSVKEPARQRYINGAPAPGSLLCTFHEVLAATVPGDGGAVL